MTPSAALSVPRAVRHAIVEHARRDQPMECCGFIVGSSSRAMFVVPMANAQKSRVRYRIDDRSHIELRRTLREIRPSVSIIGVYHSHPAGYAWPSDTDIAEAMYPDWTHLIVGLRGRRPVLRGFRIRDGRVRPVRLR